MCKSLIYRTFTCFFPSNNEKLPLFCTAKSINFAVFPYLFIPFPYYKQYFYIVFCHSKCHSNHNFSFFSFTFCHSKCHSKCRSNHVFSTFQGHFSGRGKQKRLANYSKIAYKPFKCLKLSVLYVHLFFVPTAYQMALNNHCLAVDQMHSITQSCVEQCALLIAYLFGR